MTSKRLGFSRAEQQASRLGKKKNKKGRSIDRVRAGCGV
jgi:hypothetical protein